MDGRSARERGRTKAYLVDRVYDRHGALTKQEAADVVDALLGSMKAALLDGRPVRIQNFGVFEVVSRRGRAGINPADGQPLFIPAHRGLQFRPSKLMRQEVEQPEPPDDPAPEPVAPPAAKPRTPSTRTERRPLRIFSVELVDGRRR